MLHQQQLKEKLLRQLERMVVANIPGILLEEEEVPKIKFDFRKVKEIQ